MQEEVITIHQYNKKKHYSMKLTENELKAYITEAINQELNEKGLGGLIKGLFDLGGKAAEKSRGPVGRFLKNLAGNSDEIADLQNKANEAQRKLDAAKRSYTRQETNFTKTYVDNPNLSDKQMRNFGADERNLTAADKDVAAAETTLNDANRAVEKARRNVRNSRIGAGVGLVGGGAYFGGKSLLGNIQANKRQRAIDNAIGAQNTPSAEDLFNDSVRNYGK